MKKGFTLIELLVVISIIGVLSAVVAVALNEARGKARDARRKADVAKIVEALHIHNARYGNFIESGSGCGSSGNGNGWFSYGNGTTYPKSIAECLVDSGVVPDIIKDPSGKTAGIYSYMKYSCATGTYVYATLESEPTQVDGPTNNTCCAGCDTSYGMNYVIHLD